MKTRIWITCMALLAGACVPSWAAKKNGFRLASPPTSVEHGQQVLLCAANVGTGAVEVTLELQNVRTGAVVADKTVKLFPSGSAPAASDPCLTTTPDPANQSLLAAVVTVRNKAFFRELAVTASIQVLASTPDGGMRTVQTVPLRPANRGGGDVVYVPTP